MSPQPATQLSSVVTERLPDSIDGLEFIMVSSTASSVDPKAPTRFRYRQQGSMIWGAYMGDSVTVGRFVGRIRDKRVEIRFVHDLVAGGCVSGEAVSTLERRSDGLLYLAEEFEKDGEQHVSLCVQAPALDSWPEYHSSEAGLDGKEFILERSTASEVNPGGPSRFSYRECNSIVWGSYSGDTVTAGHFAGVLREGTLEENFVHEAKASRSTLMGHSSSSLEKRADGRLELIEEFVLEGVPGRSVCVEAPSGH